MMKKIDLERERGFPFALAVAYFADGKSVMFTGDRFTISNYIPTVAVPTLVKYTVYTSEGKVPQFDLEIPRDLIDRNESFTIKQLTGGDLHRRRRTNLDPLYRVADIDDLNKIHRRRMFCVTRTRILQAEQELFSEDTRVCDILCTFRTLPNTFPNKLRDVLIKHTKWRAE